METVLGLILIPIAAAFGLLAAPSIRAQYLLTGLGGLLLMLLALLFWGAGAVMFGLPHGLHLLIIAADAALLLYFAREGMRHGSWAVTSLALLQLLLFIVAELAAPAADAAVFAADALTKWMFLIINIVGSIIVFFAVRYMQDETMPFWRKRLFIAYLLLFLSVMNTLVVANDLLLFFFLFEMTTLASYLLIGFRKDPTAEQNALRALWMNQVGGVAILLASLVAVAGFDTLALDRLLAASGGWMPLAVALLAMAAFVKGAAIPFDGWLLGAMVAPTPVSAMLHSATMVKIAPFLILKLSGALAGTLTGAAVSVTGILVFVTASYLALSKSVFKEILGYSTIALLGLMMSLAAVGTVGLMQVALLLMLFHALSKALLFLSAGVLEKQHHLKEIDAMKGLLATAPKSVAFILLGFVSLTLPPFALFMGKLFALELLAGELGRSPWLLIVLVGVAVGSILLVLLYFKVASALFSKPDDLAAPVREAIPFGFMLPLSLLSLLVFAAAAGMLFAQPGGNLSILAIPLVVIGLLPWLLRRFEGFERVSEYRCGEKAAFDGALFYFGPDEATRRRIRLFFGILFAAVGVSGVIA